jgi:hypothetical protein
MRMGGEEDGAPCTIRTCDLLVRSQTLYPAELRALEAGAAFVDREGRDEHRIQILPQP